jgi:hypothetical protein
VAVASAAVVSATIFVPAANAATTNPAITPQNCNSATVQWIHFYYTAAAHHGPVCFAHPGTYTLPNPTFFVSLCAGNNFGHANGQDLNGNPTVDDFSPGSSKQSVEDFVFTITQTHGETDGFSCPSS